MSEHSDDGDAVHGDGMDGDGMDGDGMQLEPADEGSGRSGTRRRVGVGLAAVVLVAAAGGVGYGLGHSFADDQDDAGADELAPASEAEAPETLPPVESDVATTDASTDR